MCGDDPCEADLAWVVAAHVSPILQCFLGALNEAKDTLAAAW